MKNKSIFLLLSCILFTISCNTNTTIKSAGVVINNESSEKENESIKHIVIDDSLAYDIAIDTSILINLSVGKHILNINKIPKGDFFVNENGGMINLNEIEFVIYNINYEGSIASKLGMNNNTYNFRSNVILIDSFVVQEKIAKDEYPDSVLMKFLTGSDSTTIDQVTGKLAYKNMNNDFRNVGKGKIYIERDWDYGLTDTIPEQIETTGDANIGGLTTIEKSTIVSAKLFLIYAMLSKDEYIVKDIRDVRKGKNDSRKEKNNKEKQMEF